MAANKTIPTGASVTDFLDGVSNAERRADGYKLLDMFKEVTNEEAVMWGPSIIGFGQYHYKYASGHEGDMCLTGFSPRAQQLVLYVGASAEHNKPLLAKLGKHNKGKSCLYIKRLSDVDLTVLKEIIKTDYNHSKTTYNA